ncbi:unnamed protein product [Ixodes pacificus]
MWTDRRAALSTGHITTTSEQGPVGGITRPHGLQWRTAAVALAAAACGRVFWAAWLLGPGDSSDYWYGACSASPTGVFSVLFSPCIESCLEGAANDVTRAGALRCRSSRPWWRVVKFPAKSAIKRE